MHTYSITTASKYNRKSTGEVVPGSGIIKAHTVEAHTRQGAVDSVSNGTHRCGKGCKTLPI